jgi:hypothetical protein
MRQYAHHDSGKLRNYPVIFIVKICIFGRLITKPTMKFSKPLAMLIVPALIILSSCKKTYVAPPPIPGMSFKVNGTLVQTDTEGATNNTHEKVLDISGVENDNSSSIDLAIPNAQLRTYDVVKDSLIILYYDIHGNTATYYKAESGTVTITAISATSVSGTFQFIAPGAKTGQVLAITAGQFIVNIVK